MKTTIFPDNTFVKHMDDEVAEWQRHCLKSRFFNSFDGAELSARFAVNPESIGSVIFVHGFTEFTEKYLEMLYYFYNEGYSVFMYDQRGHGHSARFVEEDYLVHIDTFDTYVNDLDCFINRLVLHETPGGPFFLFAHSMGGCIAALYLERRPDFFRKAILSSPMLRLTFGSIPMIAGKAMAATAKLLNREESPVPGAQPFDETPHFEEGFATCEQRFLWVHRLQVTSGAYHNTSATYGWVSAALKAVEDVQKNAGKADLPILLCQAGLETIVDNSGQDDFSRSAPNVKFVRFPKSKHEIFLSTADVLKTYYDTLFEFLE